MFFVLKSKEHQDVVEEQSPREIKEVENKERVQDQESELKPPQKLEEEALPLIIIDDNDSQVSTKRLRNSMLYYVLHLERKIISLFSLIFL